MLHHLSLAVRDLREATRFYDPVLGALGYVRVWSFPDAVGYGPPGEGDRFALKQRGEAVQAPGPGFHVAFAAPTRAAVEAFWAQAMRHGGGDNGAPGLRERYGPDYFAAFVIDHDGYHLEAVCKAR